MAQTSEQIANKIFAQMLSYTGPDGELVTFGSIEEAIEAGYLDLNKDTMLYWLGEAADEALSD